MNYIYVASSLIFAYLLGSIPSSVWIGKIFYHKDIRKYGSGNAGASNTFRILGVKAGIPVLLIDVAKGIAAVTLAYFFPLALNQDHYILFQIILGICAVVGHIFPIFAGFKGGKGVATLLGVVIGIQPQAALAALAIFIIVLFLTRIVSLSSMLAGISFPILLIFMFHEHSVYFITFSILGAVLLVLTHRNNIKRMIHRQESKANLFGWLKKKTK